jgi:hypothetical protein
MGMSSLSSLAQTFSEAMEDGNVSIGTMVQMTMSLSMGLSALIGGFKALGAIEVATMEIEGEETAVTLANVVAKTLLSTKIGGLIAKQFGLQAANLSATASMVVFVAAIAAAVIAIAGVIKILDILIVTS